MNSEPTRRVRSSARSEESIRRVISPTADLTVYGSPAPTYFQRPAPVKTRKPKQPPNTPNDLFKTRKPLQLPIEKILMLNEKLKNDNREKIRMELSPRQIKLQDSEDEQRRTKSSGRYRAENGGKNDEDSMDFSSSTIDLSIDLSTVTDSDRESDLTSEDQDDFDARPLVLKEKQGCSSSTCTESPSRYVWRLKSDNIAVASEGSTETGYPCSPATKSSTAPSSDFCNESCNTTQRSSLSCDNPLRHSPKCFRSRSADLIHLYVRTVDNRNKLTKYFRPCHTCNEACCVCPDLLPESSRSFSVYCDTLKYLRESDYRRVDKMVETDPEITDFEKCVTQFPHDKQTQSTSRSNSRNSEFSDFLVERYLHKGSDYRNNNSELVCDSGTSTLQLDDVNESETSQRMDRTKDNRKSIPLSVMQLATAAQCARILANSLESVLEIVDNDREEYFKGKDIVRFKGEDLNEMFESLSLLKNYFSAREQKSYISVNALQKKWIDFTGNESPTSRVAQTFPCQKKYLGGDQQEIDAAFGSNAKTCKSDEITFFEDNFDEKYLPQP